MKYKIWLENWLAHYVEPSSKKRTFRHYSKAAEIHILPYLGELELSELTPYVLQKFIAELTTDGNKRTGEALSTNFVKSIASIIQLSLKSAHLSGYLPEYSASKIKCPKAKEKQVDCFTFSEQKKLEEAALSAKKIKFRGFVICLYTGLRIGELLALKWSDIDFEKGVLSVTKASYDETINGEHVRIIDTPKTESSKRRIPLPKSLVKILRKMKRKSKCEFVIADGEKPVFTRSYQRSFELFLKKNGLPHKGFHSLRHTFATRAIECGMDVKTLSEILGHKNASITLNRYVHSLWEHKAEMMNKLSEML